jgi:hypothetical protein
MILQVFFFHDDASIVVSWIVDRGPAGSRASKSINADESDFTQHRAFDLSDLLGTTIKNLKRNSNSRNSIAHQHSFANLIVHTNHEEDITSVAINVEDQPWV